MEIKTIKNHYRNTVKSDYLAADDVRALVREYTKCVLTIKSVSQHLQRDDSDRSPKQQFRMNGQRGDWNIIHWKEDLKSWVVNSTNTKTILKFVKGKDDDELVTTWAGLTIQLVVDESISFAGNQGGVIVMHELPLTEANRPTLTPDDPKWDEWKETVNTGISAYISPNIDEEAAKVIIRENLEKQVIISDSHWKLLCANL